MHLLNCITTLNENLFTYWLLTQEYKINILKQVSFWHEILTLTYTAIFISAKENNF